MGYFIKEIKIVKKHLIKALLTCTQKLFKPNKKMFNKISVLGCMITFELLWLFLRVRFKHIRLCIIFVLYGGRVPLYCSFTVRE